MLNKKMNFDEILFLTKMYQHTAEAFLTEEERHILLKALDIAEKVKKIVK